ncbi:YdeI/OmpD-associated family protein [Aestuariibaculum suncheonense]|uniref:YdeI/OmpD-associated family protein n=2 Tax=Aestuariibaculum suncheonense TaxID=1028745 RepID=A0A8J6Q615_9FLAO|nr:YdeI/OmpD-associated family protein [Aestuariibaculum suncheonense]
MTTDVETFFTDGCGRCALGGTPDCKVHNWDEELHMLRTIILECGLTETCKWGVPCYTYNNSNVLMLSAFKNYCSLNFFKGVLLSNDKGLLVAPGENSQAVRQLKFTSTEQINPLISDIKACIFEAIEIEKQGLSIPTKKRLEPLPEELEQKFEEDPVLKSAFEELTPGRQRGYILYFSAAKQSATRLSRIEKCSDNILNGIGLHDKYTSNKK